MGISQTAKIALVTSTFGALAFIFGVIAENKKPPYGTPIPGKGVTICSYPKDPTVALGALSAVTLLISAGMGVFSVKYPYKGQHVPFQALIRSTSFLVFLCVAGTATAFAFAMTLWATIAEGLQRSHNVYPGVLDECTTAKTGLFGGAAFLALDSTLFWLVCQMLVLNAREDYLEEEDPKGNYGQVLVTDYGTDDAEDPTSKV